MPPRKKTGGLKPASSGARYTRTHLTGATSKLKHPKPKKGEAAQARLENWDFTCDPLTEEQRARNGRVRGRDLVSWNKPRMMEKCMLNFVYECMRTQVKIPWDDIAHRFHPGMSANALKQRFDRLRKELIAEGHLVPPTDISHGRLYRGMVRANQNPIDGDLKTTRIVRYEEPFLDSDFNLPDSTNFVHNPSIRARAGISDAESEPEQEPELPSGGEESAGNQSQAESEREQSQENLAAEWEELPPPPQRKRGRPRGSTKQRKRTIESEDEEPPRSAEKRRRSSRSATMVRKRHTYDLQESDDGSQATKKKRSISDVPKDYEDSDGSVTNEREQVPRQPKRSRPDHQGPLMPSGPHGLGRRELPSHGDFQGRAFGSQQGQMRLRPAPGSFYGNQAGSPNFAQPPPSIHMPAPHRPARSQAPFQCDEYGRMISMPASRPDPRDNYWGAGDEELERQELERQELQRQMIQAAAYTQRLAQKAQGLGLQPLGFGLQPQTFQKQQQNFQQQPQRLAAQLGNSPTRMGRQILRSSAVLESQQQYPASFQRPATQLEESILTASRSNSSDCSSPNTESPLARTRAKGTAATMNDTATPMAIKQCDTIHVAGRDDVRTPVGTPLGPNNWNVEFPPSGASGNTIATADSVDDDVQRMLDACAAERLNEAPAAGTDFDLRDWVRSPLNTEDDVS
ncbi:hypothetical protein DL766_000812 [Monosporascus sp. MC13-8B]|uniref:Myb-like domain-containing protein n=1 Tax=Monosporascus cannonballus TaxID=155416 RepID=A0ABY0HHC2_9PEZI|nr:hypothetical protein DL762_001121 [Monosporascus cannonballus]RYO98398.1 hypothetical protein DL763_002237 [Monosporascus cannonballus]RYP38812.1 hypothetical protein DL766_000812 [Monosporascus sp. MC13-8B]